MKTKMFRWNIFYLSIIIEVLLSYLLPFRRFDEVRAGVGFPLSFITLRNTSELALNPMMSMHLNPLSLIINISLIYIAIYFVIRAYKKSKEKLS